MSLDLITPLFLGPIEMGVIFLIVVLLFGASKVPELARSSGEAVGEFKKGREEMEKELENVEEDLVGEEPETTAE